MALRRRPNWSPQVAEEPEPAVATVPDDEEHAAFERIDGRVALGRAWRWSTRSCSARPRRCSATGTCSRRCFAARLQDGALRIAVAGGIGGEPLLVESAEQLQDFQRTCWSPRRAAPRSDWASRFILPLVEEFATEQLMETAVRPGWLIWAALGLTLGAARSASLRGWLGAGLVLLLLLRRRSTWSQPACDACGLRPLPRGCGRSALVAGRGHRLACARLVGVALRSGLGCARLPRWLPRPSPKRRGSSERRCRRRATVAVLAPQRDLRRDPLRAVGAWTAYLIALLAYAAMSSSSSSMFGIAPELTRS